MKSVGRYIMKITVPLTVNHVQTIKLIEIEL